MGHGRHRMTGVLLVLFAWPRRRNRQTPCGNPEVTLDVISLLSARLVKSGAEAGARLRRRRSLATRGVKISSRTGNTPKTGHFCQDRFGFSADLGTPSSSKRRPCVGLLLSSWSIIMASGIIKAWVMRSSLPGTRSDSKSARFGAGNALAACCGTTTATRRRSRLQHCIHYSNRRNRSARIHGGALIVRINNKTNDEAQLQIGRCSARQRVEQCGFQRATS